MKLKQWLYKLTHWEEWHYHVKYIPIAPVWLWYIIKSRNAWFFTASNPSLSFGGMDGESKEEMYSQLPDGTYPTTIYINPELTIPELRKAIEASGLVYPIAVKPNVGMGGMMFRKINDKYELYQYHEKMDRRYVVQEMVMWPMEVAIFYYRHPASEKGVVSGFISKENPSVIGDGVSKLSQLVEQHPGVRFLMDSMYAKHKKNWDKVIPIGERFVLTDVSNRTQGGKMVSLAHEIDDKLLGLMDSISKHKNTFFYGRYDIKCNSVAELKEGKKFSILEFNGCGSGVQHVYGNNHSLFEACSIILKHWKALYKISVYNHKHGIPYWTYNDGMKFMNEAKAELKHLKELEAAYND